MALNDNLVTVRDPRTNVTKKVKKNLAKDYAIAGWVVVEEKDYSKVTSTANYTSYPYKK